MMWAEFCKRWFDLCCCWLPTTKGEQKSGAEAKPSPTMADDDADDLTVIKGIGPSIQTMLRSFGVNSLAALAASDPEALAAKVKASQPISTTRVKGWIEVAQDQTTGRT